MLTRVGLILSVLLVLPYFFLVLGPHAASATEFQFSVSETSRLPIGIASNYSTVLENRLFSIGGANSLIVGDIYKTLIGADGYLDSWTAEPPFLENVFWHSGSVYGRNLYILGGVYESTGHSTGVYLSKVGIDGVLGSWQGMNSLPDSRAQGQAVATASHLYFLGGMDGSGSKNTVYFSAINPDGTLGPWETTTPLPIELIGHGAVNTGNHIVVVGGQNSSSVYSVTINSDGTLGSWATQPPLPTTVYRGNLVQVNNHLVLLGGVVGSSVSNTIYYTELDVNGLPGEWSVSTTLLDGANCCSSAAVNGNNIYLIGGHDGVGYYDEVWVISTSLGSTPTPTPSPTLAPTPTPPTDEDVLIFVPGMGASWNYEALVHGEDVENNDWNLGYYVTAYDGFIQALENEGLVQGNDFFVYSYDWRKPIDENANSLKEYIEEEILPDRPPETKIDLVGHSMGGLLVKSLAQKIPSKIDKTITIGSPHLGSAMAYKIWEGGSVDGFSGWEGIGIKLLLEINNENGDTKVENIQSNIPSFLDVLPVYEFLKNRNGTIKQLTSLSFRNNFLFDLKSNTHLVGNLTTIGGKSLDTDQSYTVTTRDREDLREGRWVDGKPISTQKGSGDEAVLASSSIVTGSNLTYLSNQGQHGDLLNRSEVQSLVFDVLDIEASPVIKDPVHLNKSIVVTIASPATWELIYPDGSAVQPTDNLVVVENPTSGNYQVRLTSTSPGNYKLFFGRLSYDDQAWDVVSGEFSKSGIQTQYSFPVNMDTRSLGDDPVADSILEIDKLAKFIQNSRVDKYRKNLLLINLDGIKTSINHYLKTGKNSKFKIAKLNLSINLVNNLSERIEDGYLWKALDTQTKNTILASLKLVEEDLEEELANIN